MEIFLNLFVIAICFVVLSLVLFGIGIKRHGTIEDILRNEKRKQDNNKDE